MLDARVQELKKTSMAEQAELRDLRVKLRSAEHERTQLAAKQSDAAEARKAALLPDGAGVASHATSWVLSGLLFRKEGRAGSAAPRGVRGACRS